jgi:DNA-binding transcriptional MerR regulator
MTVDDLARAAATSTRNIRALQTKGLLPGPALLGRTGEYGTEHLVRLQAVLRLQAKGFSLAAIKELLAAWEHGLSLEDVLGLPPRRTRRRRGRGGDGDVFDELVGSLPTWRGPRAGLLPGAVTSAN